MKLGAACAIAVTLGGCALAGEDGSNGGDGKADGTGGSYIGYIQANTPFYWAPSDYASFQSVGSLLGLPPTPTPIASTDALAQRLQAWVDKIDGVVRAEVKATTGNDLVAPKPIVEILPSASTFNAWVSPTVACTGVSPPGSTAGATSFLSSAQLITGSPYSCVRPTYPGVSDFETFWNRHTPACKVGDDGTVSGSSCSIVNNGSGGELELVSTAQYVHISTDLIAAVDERTLVVVLAHELGHYYRGHVTDATIQHYNFWYDTEADRKKVPVPATNAAQLQADYEQIANGPKSLQTAVTGTYSPRLRTFIVTVIAPLLAERTETDFVCAAARDALGPWEQSLLAGYGLPSDAMTPYLDFESKLAACAPSLNLAGDPGSTSLDAGVVLIAMMNSKLPSVTLPFHSTLADVLSALDAKARKLDAKEAALLAQVQMNRIGLYTVEEEADDIALELSSRLGIAPDDVVKSWQVFMAAIANAVPDYYRQQYLDENTMCAQWLSTGFANADGSPIFVPIGDLSEPHHSDCYRLFNFWREQKLRQYTIDTPLAFPSDWQTAQDEARQLTQMAASLGQ